MKEGKPAYLAISILTQDEKFYCVVGKIENGDNFYCRGENGILIDNKYPLILSSQEAIEEIKYFSRKTDAEIYSREQNDIAKKEGFYKFEEKQAFGNSKSLN